MSSTPDPAHGRIFCVRQHRVILDSDLARLYGVPTHVFNQAVKRNRHRFPEDFAFQLTKEEAEQLKAQAASSTAGEANWSQSVTSSRPVAGPRATASNSSQSVMSSKAKHRGATYRPWAFTEHGAVMAANVLRSVRAVEMSVYVVRAFVKQREALVANAVILKRLAEIDKTLIEHDSALQIVWRKLQPLLNPPPEKPKRRIGFLR